MDNKPVKHERGHKERFRAVDSPRCGIDISTLETGLQSTSLYLFEGRRAGLVPDISWPRVKDIRVYSS